MQEDGFFYASFKYGDGQTERAVRIFTDYNEKTAKDLFEKAGFKIIVCEESLDVRPNREGEKWVNVIARK